MAKVYHMGPDQVSKLTLPQLMMYMQDDSNPNEIRPPGPSMSYGQLRNYIADYRAKKGKTP